jgi:hypothetical protein
MCDHRNPRREAKAKLKKGREAREKKSILDYE